MPVQEKTLYMDLCVLYMLGCCNRRISSLTWNIERFRLSSSLSIVQLHGKKRFLILLAQ